MTPSLPRATQIGSRQAVEALRKLAAEVGGLNAFEPASEGSIPMTTQPNRLSEALREIRKLSRLDNALSEGASAAVMSRMADIHQHADAALSLPDQPDSARVGVKELEWRSGQNEGFWYADSYTIRRDAGEPELFIVSGWYGVGTNPYCNLEAAKAAAQADYERRILSALSHPAPAQDERVEALREALDFVNEASGAALGIAVSGSSHPNPDGVLMELSQKGMALASRLSTTISAKEEGRG